MERLSNHHILNQPFNIETIQHVNRYTWAAKFTHGNVLDIACGIGYGSQVLSAFTSYLGIDISAKTIEQAQKLYANDKIQFQIGNIFDLKISDKTLDCIVTFETLEHLKQPQKALTELTRVLKDDGILIGSVPTLQTDNLVTAMWEKNPYHLTHFSLNKLRDLLLEKFKYVSILLFTEIVGTKRKPIFDNFHTTITPDRLKLQNDHINDIIGSYVFIAFNDSKHILKVQETIENNNIFQQNCNFYDFYKTNFLPTFKAREKYISELETHIKESERSQGLIFKIILRLFRLFKK